MSLSANVRDASIFLGRYTCQRRSCKPSRSLGLLQSGVLIWSAPCSERQAVIHISSSPLTNSPNGLRPNLSPRSQPPRPRSSSRTLWSDSAFLIGLSQIMALSSPGWNSQTGAKRSASRSATLPWHTHKATGRWNVPTAWYSRVSSQGYLIGSNRTQANGLGNYHQYYGR